MSPAVMHAEEAAEKIASSVTLTWTAPGDDGHSGTPARYDLRYSRSMITGSNFLLATPVPFVPLPGPGGGFVSVILSGLPAGGGYYFALKTVDEAGNWSGLSNVVFWDGNTVAVNALLLGAAMSGPWPNPARGSTRFRLTIPEALEARVEIMDVTGRRVRILVAGVEIAGVKEYSWNFRDDVGRRLGPGVYLIRARVGESTFTRRVVAIE